MSVKQKKKIEKTSQITGVQITTKHFVIDDTSGRDTLEFVILSGICDQGEVFKLLKSGADFHSGAVLLTAVDTGNEIILSSPLQENYEYVGVYHLLVLLTFMDKVSRIPAKFKFLQEVLL